MGFSFATFLAQLLNLFVLIWILKHFLYQPVLRIIEKRQTDINNQIQQAELRLCEASQLQKNLDSQKQSFERLQQQRFDELSNDIAKQKSLMLSELKTNYENEQKKLQNDLDNTWERAETTIKEMLATEFLALSEKVLTEWSTNTSIDQIIFLFQRKVLSLSKTQLHELQNILLQQHTLLVYTSHKLNKEQKSFIEQIFVTHFTLPKKLRFQFKQKPELILGIEVSLNGFHLEWNLNTCLEEIAQRLKQNISGLIRPSQRKDDK